MTFLAAHTSFLWSLALIWNQQRSWNTLLQNLLFAILSKKWFLHMGVGFLAWRGFGMHYDLDSYLNTIFDMFVYHWDQNKWVRGLGMLNCTFWLVCNWLVHQDKTPTLNRGQIKMACALCFNFRTFVIFYELDLMKKEPGQNGLWFGNGVVSN